MNPAVKCYERHPFWDSQIDQKITFVRVTYLTDKYANDVGKRHTDLEAVFLILEKINYDKYRVIHKLVNELEIVTKYSTDKKSAMMYISDWFDKYSNETFVEWVPIRQGLNINYATPVMCTKETKPMLQSKPSILDLKKIVDLEQLINEANISPREARARVNYPK